MMGFIEFRDFKYFTNVASSIFRNDSLKDKTIIMYIFKTQITHVCALRSLVRYDKSNENRIDFDWQLLGIFISLSSHFFLEKLIECKYSYGKGVNSKGIKYF